jgi:hypothetical protein
MLMGLVSFLDNFLWDFICLNGIGAGLIRLSACDYHCLLFFLSGFVCGLDSSETTLFRYGYDISVWVIWIDNTILV